jgi:hypothetical protein
MYVQPSSGPYSQLRCLVRFFFVHMVYYYGPYGVRSLPHHAGRFAGGTSPRTRAGEPDCPNTSIGSSGDANLSLAGKVTFKFSWCKVEHDTNLRNPEPSNLILQGCWCMWICISAHEFILGIWWTAGSDFAECSNGTTGIILSDI